MGDEYVAKCRTCRRIIERGDLEECGDAIEDHDQFHETSVLQPPKTDGGHDPRDIERLHYAAGTNGRRRRLHVDAGCPGLADANSVHDCPVTHPPRGKMCTRCAADLTLADIERAHRTTTDGGWDFAGGPAATPHDYGPPRGESVRQLRGVGDQDPGCVHSDDDLPCVDCFLGGDRDGE